MSLIRQLLTRYSVNREVYYKAQLVVCFAFVEIGITTIYYLVHPHFDFRVPRIVFSGLGVAVILQLFLLRTPLPLPAIAHSLIATLWISFCIGIATSGGILSLVMPWLSVMPVMANLLIHQRAATVWAFISLTSILVFFLIESVPALEHHNWRSLAANSGLVVITFVFTWLFHKANTNLVAKVSSKNKKLEVRKDRLIAQHLEIQGQKSFIEKQNQLLHAQNRSIEKINSLLQERVQEITTRNEILGQHWQTLLAITKSYTINFGRLEEALTYITQTVSKSLIIDRVSIWRYHADAHKIVCVQITDVNDPVHQPEDDLTLAKFPKYYNALMLEQVIPTVEAQEHWQTRELKESYLVPRKIVSMLDSPFFVSGKLGGVICCEHRQKRIWANEDILFVQAVSDIVTLSIMNQERRNYETTLIEKQEEITLINQSLEVRVKQRTEELEKQNSQLAEYAYINSHLLRAPLSRLLGLVNLVRYSEIAGSEREQVIRQIHMAGQELDGVIAKINEALNHDRSFDRSFFIDKKF